MVSAVGRTGSSGRTGIADWLSRQPVPLQFTDRQVHMVARSLFQSHGLTIEINDVAGLGAEFHAHQMNRLPQSAIAVGVPALLQLP